MPFHKTVRDWALGKKKRPTAKRMRKRAAAGKGGRIGVGLSKSIARRRQAIKKAGG